MLPHRISPFRGALVECRTFLLLWVLSLSCSSLTGNTVYIRFGVFFQRHGCDKAQKNSTLSLDAITTERLWRPFASEYLKFWPEVFWDFHRASSRERVGGCKRCKKWCNRFGQLWVISQSGGLSLLISFSFSICARHSLGFLNQSLKKFVRWFKIQKKKQ